MGAETATSAPSRARVSGAWDDLKASFGLPAGLAMVAGLVAGFGLPAVDKALDVQLPVFSFATQSAAQSLLGTIATVTVSVAGLAFSVTVVAFTLTASQLSPRVLRTFRGDRLSQAVLAIFLGTFIYCIAVLIRLGGSEEGARVPNLSITLAVILAFVSFAMFAAFIAHIVNMLQPSSVISGIVADARTELSRPYPGGVGQEPEDPAKARALVRSRTQGSESRAVRAEGEGYLTLLRGEALMSAARRHDGFVRQAAAIGDYVVPGEVIAEVWADGDDGEQLAEAVAQAFELGAQRSLVQDVAFPVRQLADIALKGLSPGINDPTTAENATEALTATLVRVARTERPAEVRVDEQGNPRFLASVPALDDLVRLGFEQVRVFAAPYPVVSIRLLELLEQIARAAREAGVEHDEVARQAALVREGPRGEVPTDADADEVARAHTRLHTPTVR